MEYNLYELIYPVLFYSFSLWNIHKKSFNLLNPIIFPPIQYAFYNHSLGCEMA